MQNHSDSFNEFTQEIHKIKTQIRRLEHSMLEANPSIMMKKVEILVETNITNTHRMIADVEHKLNNVRCALTLSGYPFEDRIENLESYMEMEDRITVSEVLLRLIELERFQEITRSQYEKVIKAKVLHICPTCDGQGVLP